MKPVPVPTHLRGSLTDAKKLRTFAEYYFKIIKTTPNAYMGKKAKERLSKERLLRDPAIRLVSNIKSDDISER